jgi:hypothetical protein
MMSKRPLSVTVIGWLFVCVGCASLIGGGWRFVRDRNHAGVAESRAHDLLDFGFVAASAVLAVVGGTFALRGCHWARWLLVVWMGLHVVLSLFHSASELLMHCVLFAVILWFLFRQRASAYFRTTPLPLD